MRGFDMDVEVPGELRQIFAGKGLSKGFFAPSDGGATADLSTLWLLRNAVYARCGRTSKYPDLNRYFYGKWTNKSYYAAEDGTLKGVLPRKRNPNFSDSMLAAKDRETVKAITAEEKRRKGSD